ncbi:hypothetical protein AA957_13090 [Pseudomonas trivialis]|uniref:Uncharacterized protein n=1 Tax=Pseudomonas trivialis TaxID=200450 RepID=A0A0H5AAF5_9PSED|nr:hypothetical protein AA957_13090 [Pseudomonas trivialis]
MPVTKAMTGRLSICDALIQEVAQNRSVGPITTRISPHPFLRTGRLSVFSTKAATARSRVRLIQSMYSAIVLATLMIGSQEGKANRRQDDAAMAYGLSPFHIHGFSRNG